MTTFSHIIGLNTQHHAAPERPDGTERDIASRAREHLLRVSFEQHLASERDDAAWYERNPEYVERWADLYAEHQIRLALLEKIEQGTR